MTEIAAFLKSFLEKAPLIVVSGCVFLFTSLLLANPFGLADWLGISATTSEGRQNVSFFWAVSLSYLIAAGAYQGAIDYRAGAKDRKRQASFLTLLENLSDNEKQALRQFIYDKKTALEPAEFDGTAARDLFTKGIITPMAGDHFFGKRSYYALERWAREALLKKHKKYLK